MTRASSASSDRRRPAPPWRWAAALLPLNSTMLAVALPDIASGLGSGVAATTLAGHGLRRRDGRARAVRRAPRRPPRPPARRAVGPRRPSRPPRWWPAWRRRWRPLVVARLGAGRRRLAGRSPTRSRCCATRCPTGRRAAGFGLLGSAVGAAAAIGPPLGGALAGWLGWRAIFLVNVPVVAAAVVLTVRGSRPGRAGAAGTARARAAGRTAPLRVPAFAAATGAVGLSNLSMYATLLAVPVVLSHRPGWSTADAGLALAHAVRGDGRRRAAGRPPGRPPRAPRPRGGRARPAGRRDRRPGRDGGAPRRPPGWPRRCSSRASASASPTRRCRRRRSRPSTRATPASPPGLYSSGRYPAPSCPRRCSPPAGRRHRPRGRAVRRRGRDGAGRGGARGAPARRAAGPSSGDQPGARVAPGARLARGDGRDHAVPDRRPRGGARRPPRRAWRTPAGPSAETVDDWSQGIPLAYVQDLCRYWADELRLAGDRGPAERVRRSSAPSSTGSASTSSTSARPQPDAAAAGHHPRLARARSSSSSRSSARSPTRPPTAATPADAFHVVCPSLPGLRLQRQAGRARVGRRRASPRRGPS